ncbi:phage recombination protein Bet [Candidatus Bartonella washoeensis]|uniref:Phage recombination protein Bet n=1 Tax=Candidatus Bartonella washoeensis Sb944nv TaxID=1094563 RepID=J0YQM2_9HYPH|nr:phage recombination protein Bet [Bartonella washoeensis Sb944nv]SPU27746.1 phage recombination protein Bet [Bartonella washoeensis]
MTNSTLTRMASKYGFSHEEFRKTIIKTCIGCNFSDEEFAAFLSVANTYGLNPLTKEIYVFPKKGGDMIPVVSIDGWIKIIKSNPDFDGMTFQDQLDKDGNLIAIKCAIRLKNIKDPIEVTEYLEECKQEKVNLGANIQHACYVTKLQYNVLAMLSGFQEFMKKMKQHISMR